MRRSANPCNLPAAHERPVESLFLAENEPDEVGKILAVWKRLFGIDVEEARRRDNRIPKELKPVGAHLKLLRRRQG
ncbi:MAG TPA: hypothetical protein VGR30_04335 [Candidatus Binatia bacterium]|nr:hypothetical protein [Candidatus Binatia bacterium]